MAEGTGQMQELRTAALHVETDHNVLSVASLNLRPKLEEIECFMYSIKHKLHFFLYSICI